MNIRNFILGAITVLLCVQCTSIFQSNSKTKNMNQEKRIKVLMQTPMGDMTIELYNETPLHRDNFVKLVKENFYDSLLFHRVIKDFMIQGGDPQSKHAAAGQQLGNGGLDYTIPAEFDSNFFHKKGVLAAARTGDAMNPQKASSSCQFYIVQGKKLTDSELQMAAARGIKLSPQQIDAYKTIGGTPWLDGSYTIFGEVTEGLDVIDKIAAVKTAPGDRPIEDVRILKVTIIK